jgi:hypothetical protein
LRRITPSESPHCPRDKHINYIATPKWFRTLLRITKNKAQGLSYQFSIFLTANMPTKKSNLAAYQNISPDSGFPIVIHPHFNPKIKDHVPDELLRKEITPPKDRAFFADPEKNALFSVGKPVDLTEQLGPSWKEHNYRSSMRSNWMNLQLWLMREELFSFVIRT